MTRECHVRFCEGLMGEVPLVYSTSAFVVLLRKGNPQKFNLQTAVEPKVMQREIMIKEYRKNAQEYRRKVFQKDGSITINHDQTVNKVFVSSELANLDTAEMQELGYILCDMSKNPGLNALIENDHIEYWAAVFNRINENSSVDRWLKKHNPLFAFIDSNLINELKPRYNDVNNKYHQNGLLEVLFYHDFFPSVWTGFAYLEGICRRICKEYVDSEGKVLKPFRVSKKDYGPRLISKSGKFTKRKNHRVSNLKHMLELTKRVVSDDARIILNKLFQDYSTSVVFQWRNSCLHGSEDKSTTVIVLYCLISILLLDQEYA